MDQTDQRIEDNERFNEGGVLASIKYIQRDIAEIKAKLDDKYVTKDEFDPVKRLVYGMAGAILLAVVAALLSLVIRKL
jgi:site-specific recombinase